MYNVFSENTPLKGRLHLASGTNDNIVSWVGYFHVFGNDFDICFFIHLKSHVEQSRSILGARRLSYDTLADLFARSGPWYLNKWVPSELLQKMYRGGFGVPAGSQFWALAQTPAN